MHYVHNLKFHFRYRVASEGEEEIEKAPKIEYARLFKINSPEWLYITIGQVIDKFGNKIV